MRRSEAFITMVLVGVILALGFHTVRALDGLQPLIKTVIEGSQRGSK